MVQRALAAVSIALTGCQLFVSLDGFSGGVEPNEIASDGGGADAGTADGKAAEASGADASRPSDGFPVDGPPLRRGGSIESGALEFTIDGRVQLGFTQKRSWQLVQWRDLGLGVELGNDYATSMSEPIQVGYNDKYYGTRLSSEATVEILEETPARATLRTTFVHRPPNGSEHRATTTYVVYADSRIVESVIYEKTSGNLPPTDYFEYGHTNATHDQPWVIKGVDPGGFEFVRKNGEAALVAVTHENERQTSTDDEDYNRFWIHSGGYSGMFDASWEYRLYGASTPVERTAWVQSVNAAIANPVYDRIRGAWKLDAKGTGAAMFELPSAWNGPAFVIDNWAPSSLHATAAGRALAVIAAPSGTSIIVLCPGPVEGTIVFGP
jgi:hypothetical protein